jgi:hypothetical protein
MALDVYHDVTIVTIFNLEDIAHQAVSGQGLAEVIPCLSEFYKGHIKK